MQTTRIIARLDIKGPNLVKGVHLEGLRVMGDPKIYAEKYYADGIDEMIYMDTVASLYGRNNLTEFVNYTAKSIFVPLTVGGGVRSVKDIQVLLQAGADKVAINTAAIKDPELIKEAARRFGSQCIVVSIEAKKMPSGRYECFTDNGRERTSVDVFEWAERVESLGAGEILLTSVDFEGTGKGFDVELTRHVSESVSIPVIASGGCGGLQHVEEVITKGKADAVAVASALHYKTLDKVIEDCSARNYDEGNLNYLKSFRAGTVFGRKTITPLDIHVIKNFMIEQRIMCRL